MLIYPIKKLTDDIYDYLFLNTSIHADETLEKTHFVDMFEEAEVDVNSQTITLEGLGGRFLLTITRLEEI